MKMPVDLDAKIFYLLAFVPVVLTSYFYSQSPAGMAIPLYGFIILILKKSKLFSRKKASRTQKVFGLIVVFASFFIHYVASPFFPNTGFYGFANYSLYIVGLFLLFFEINALKEAFTPLFLVVAFFTSSFVSDLAKSYFTPYLPHFTSLIASVLRAIGLVTMHSSPNVIVLYTRNGPIPLMFVWGCIGFISMYVFSTILIVIMSEDPSSTKTKVIWAILGVLGIFFVNIIRILTIFVGFYFYGYAFDQVHLYIGYVLFITWSIIYLYLFSKRDVASQKIRMIYAKMKKRGSDYYQTEHGLRRMSCKAT